MNTTQKMPGVAWRIKRSLDNLNSSALTLEEDFLDESLLAGGGPCPGILAFAAATAEAHAPIVLLIHLVVSWRQVILNQYNRTALHKDDRRDRCVLRRLALIARRSTSDEYRHVRAWNTVTSCSSYKRQLYWVARAQRRRLSNKAPDFPRVAHTPSFGGSLLCLSCLVMNTQSER